MSNPAALKIIFRILFVLAVLTAPLLLCAVYYTLYALPGVTVGFFETEVRVENHTGQTLYLTPITTTYGYPQVIYQLGAIRQANIPLKSGDSLILVYDAADRPLSGLAACTKDGDCRKAEGSWDLVEVTFFNDLPLLEADWLQAVQQAPSFSFLPLIYPLIPVSLLSGSLLLRRREKKLAASPPPQTDEVSTS